MDSGIPKSVRAVLAALALVVATVGLAYAAGGVLPDKASDKATAAQEDKGDVGAERKAGSTGPEDGENESSSEDVHEVIDDRDEGGCEFGQAVAEAARGDEANEDAGAEDPCDNESNAGDDDDNDNAERKAARESEQDDRKAAREAEQDERKAGSTGPSNDDSSSDDDELEDDAEDEDSDDDEPKEKENNAGGAEQSEEARGDDHGKGNDE